MRYTNEGLTLVHETYKTLALKEDRMRNRNVSIMVGLQPPNPHNLVSGKYRVDGGPIQSLHASQKKTDYSENRQQFEATFRDLRVGQVVDYVITGSCEGRRS